MPSPNPGTRREHVGAATPSQLTGSITGSDLSFTIASGTNWPTGAVGVFYVVLDPGQPNEEKVLCSSRSGTTLTIAPTGRGQDGTAASAHSITAVAYPAWTALEADEANAHAAASADVHGITGALASASSLTSGLAGKQPLDAELTAIAGLTSAADQLPYFTGSGAAALTTLSAFIRTLLDDANAAAALATLGAQATDAELTALAGLVSAADRLPYFTGSGAASLATFTAFMRTLLDDVDAATARNTLGAQQNNATLSALFNFNANGLLTQTAAATFVARTLGSSDGSITINNGNGVSGAPDFVLADTGIVTAGIAAASGNWTLNSGSYRIMGGAMCNLHLQLTRNASTITGGSSGDITDVAIATIPAACRPNRDIRCLYAQSSHGFGSASIGASGTVQLETLHANATISLGDQVTIDFAYNLNS